MKAQCSVCDAPVELQDGVEVSEIVMCADCGSRLVVESIKNQQVMLAIAPAIEEDWGQ